MNIILTDHTKKRMAERAIKLEEIKNTVEMPDYTVTKNGKIEAHKNINNRNIKVVYSKEGKFIKIITVIDRR